MSKPIKFGIIGVVCLVLIILLFFIFFSWLDFGFNQMPLLPVDIKSDVDYSEKKSRAPGCNLASSSKRGYEIEGGCGGKEIITEFKVEPKIDCLIFRINNCNGGIIEVINTCDQNVKIANLDLAPAKIKYRDGEKLQYGGYYGVELIDENGYAIAEESEGNYASYFPITNTFLQANGQLGDQKFIISYVKTKKLCD